MSDEETTYHPHPTETVKMKHENCSYDRDRRDIVKALATIASDINEIKESLAVNSERWRRVATLEQAQLNDRAELQKVTKAVIELGPIKNIVFGAVGLTLLIIGGAVMALIIKSNP